MGGDSVPAEPAAGTAGLGGPENKSPRGAGRPLGGGAGQPRGRPESGQGIAEGTGGGGRRASPTGGQTERHSPEVLTPASPSSPTQTLLQKLSSGTLLGLGLKSLLWRVGWASCVFHKGQCCCCEGGRGWEFGVSGCKLL